MRPTRIGITIGDVNGIGLEVIFKTLAHKQTISGTIPVIYGSTKAISYHKNMFRDLNISYQNTNSLENAAVGRVNVINCWDHEINVELGKISESSGKLASVALDRATQDLKDGKIDALVTAPIHKKAMKMAGFQDIGHTEFITSAFGLSTSLMMMVSESLKVGLVTNHLPISEVCDVISNELIEKKLNIFYNSLQQDFGIDKPTIAILGLNPHAGDEGTIGNEENELIRPIIIKQKKAGRFILGPYPADGFFGDAKHLKVDGVLAMYHDQGLIPFKMSSFGSGVNFTAGLPAVRTSPDHGTAFDIAGQNIADPGSFRNAFLMAKDILKSRKEFKAFRENALVKKAQKSEGAIA